MQVACLRHFQSEPLSVLLSATAESPEALAQACDRLPHALRSSIEGSAARQSIGKTVATWRAWAVSIRWLHEAAQALGMGHSAGGHIPSSSSITWHVMLVLALVYECPFWPSGGPGRSAYAGFMGQSRPWAWATAQVSIASRVLVIKGRT